MTRALLLLLLVAVLAMGSGAAGSAPPESTPEPEEDEVTSWPFILISVILVLSISFETVKELIEHHTPHVFEPITDAFFGELATLGFIGAIAFTLTYNFDSDCHGACSVMQRLSDKLLGEPEALQEVFELLHFMLFAISVVFIFVVLALLSMTLKNAAGYEELEQMINQATTEAAQRNGRRRMSTPSSPAKSGRGNHRTRTLPKRRNRVLLLAPVSPQGNGARRPHGRGWMRLCTTERTKEMPRPGSCSKMLAGTQSPARLRRALSPRRLIRWTRS